MRSSVADPQRNDTEEKPAWMCNDNGEGQYGLSFAENLCQAESGCVMSCNSHLRCNRVFLTCRAQVSEVQSKDLSDGA